eukprot:7395287-Pyramimonas_sp.AAC.1
MGDSLPYVDLGTGRTATMLNAGWEHVCAVLDNYSVKCWGQNTYGQLGQGDTTNRGDANGQMGDNLPAVSLGTGRTASYVYASSYYFTCAVLDNGGVKCWGRNDKGQLGIGSTTDMGAGSNEMGDNLPVVDLGTGRTATMVACGLEHACVVMDNAL